MSTGPTSQTIALWVFHSSNKAPILRFVLELRRLMVHTQESQRKEFEDAATWR